MQYSDINAYYSEYFSNVDFGKNIFDEIKRKVNWIPKEYRKSIDILTFAICNSNYILNHFDEIKPTNREDAELKLYAYVRHNLNLNNELIDIFDRYRDVFHFRYYGLVKIGNGRYNPLQTYLWERLTNEDQVGNNDEIRYSLRHLIYLVDPTEKDCKENDSFYYIRNCKQPVKFGEYAQIAFNHQKVLDIIYKIHDNIQTQRELNNSLNFDDIYYPALILLPEYLKLPQYKYLTEMFNIQIDPDQLSINTTLLRCIIPRAVSGR